MPVRKLLVVMSILLGTSFSAFAADSDSQADRMTQLQFNLNVIDMKVDSAMFLHSLALLNQGNSVEVQAFMEQKLDEIVCAADQQLAEMNPAQKKWMLAQLRAIKAYRESHPRVAAVVDPQQFAKEFEPYNATYAERADEILKKLDREQGK